MKATGIIRRIDELGRIVLPKELRNTYKIKVGTPLEIFIGDGGELILKKYSLIGDMTSLAEECVEALSECLGENVLITDNEKVIAIKGDMKKLLINTYISNLLENLIEKRQNIVKNKTNLEKDEKYFEKTQVDFCGVAIVPIIANGDTLGSIMLLNKNESKIIDENILSVLKTVALILAKQVM